MPLSVFHHSSSSSSFCNSMFSMTLHVDTYTSSSAVGSDVLLASFFSQTSRRYGLKHNDCLKCNATLKTFICFRLKQRLHKLSFAYNQCLWRSAFMLMETFLRCTLQLISNLRHSSPFATTSVKASRVCTLQLFVLYNRKQHDSSLFSKEQRYKK